MKKLFSSLLCAALLVSSLAVSTSAVATGKSWGDVPTTKDTITVDGTKDKVYDKGLKVTIDTVRESGKADTVDATAYYLHDGKNVYVFVEVKDTELIANVESKKTGNYWECDGVEIMFDWTNEGKTYYKWTTWYDGWFKANDTAANDKAEIVTKKVDDQNYTVEYKIPMNGAKTGSQVGVNILVDNMTASGRVIVRAPQSLNATENEVAKYDYIVLGSTEVTGVEPKAETSADTFDPATIAVVASALSAAGLVVLKKKSK